MPNIRLASRYAKSILDLAVETGQLETVLKDMKVMKSAVEDSRELEMLLQSPIINADKKKSILQAVFGSSLSTLTMNFINLMVSKGREANLAPVADAFESLYNQREGIQKVQVITATAMNDEVRQLIESKAAQLAPGKKIVLNTSIDPELIGGFIIEVEDKRYDASVRKELNDIKKQFAENIYVPAI